MFGYRTLLERIVALQRLNGVELITLNRKVERMAQVGTDLLAALSTLTSSVTALATSTDTLAAKVDGLLTGSLSADEVTQITSGLAAVQTQVAAVQAKIDAEAAKIA